MTSAAYGSAFPLTSSSPHTGTCTLFGLVHEVKNGLSSLNQIDSYSEHDVLPPSVCPPSPLPPSSSSQNLLHSKAETHTLSFLSTARPYPDGGGGGASYLSFNTGLIEEARSFL